MKWFNDFVSNLHNGILLLFKFLFASLISYMVDFKMLFLALGWALLFDLITGIFAYMKLNKVRFSVERGEYIIKSKLLRVSFEKMGAYLMIILSMAIFETHIFKIQFDYIDGLIGQPFYGTAIVTSVCVIIEYWSILENLKIMGIDVIAKITKIIGVFLKIKNKIIK